MVLSKVQLLSEVGVGCDASRTIMAGLRNGAAGAAPYSRYDDTSTLARSGKLRSLRDIAVLDELQEAEGVAAVSCENERVAGGWMSFAGVGSFANRARAMGLQGPVTDDDLDRVVEFYRQRGEEPRVEVCPFADETLIAGLARRGFQLRDFKNIFARELPADEDLRAVHPHGWPDGLEIVRLDPASDDQLRSYLDLSWLGFGKAGEACLPHNQAASSSESPPAPPSSPRGDQQAVRQGIA